jgi:ABC-type transport system involved in multi-copper enzyme maturation permease subunit
VTAAVTWARLSYRQQRWELILVALGVALAAGLMLWFSQQLTGLVAANPDCLPPGDQFVATTCQHALDTWYATQGFADNLLLLSFVAPFGMGILLGPPLVAREIDGGTAQLAWSIGLSRRGWLLRRIAFIAAFTVACLAVLAVTSELLAAALAPERHLSQDFIWFGRRGSLIVVRGIGALMLGTLVGAVIGRVLPAILAAGLAIALAFTGVSLAMDQWHHREAVPVRMMLGPDEPSAYDASAMVVDSGVEMIDGEFVDYGELYDRGIATQVIDEAGRVFTSDAALAAGDFIGYDAMFVIPGTRYRELVAREAAVAGLIALVSLGLTALVVGGRRPM